MTDEHEARQERRSRWLIYALLMVVVLIGLSFPRLLRVQVSEEARAGYEAIQALAEGGRVAIIADYRSTEAERVLGALLRQTLGRELRITLISPTLQTAASAERVSRAALQAGRLRYGHALIHLASRDGGLEWLDRVARSFEAATDGRDFSGDELRQHPITQYFRALDDARLVVLVWDEGVVELADAARLVSSRRLELIIASPSESETASQMWQGGRLAGLVAGARAVSDYEALVAGRGSASRYLTAVTLATLFVVALILWSYMGGHLSRRRRGAASGREGRQ
jgi:hypothetical protein